MDWLLLRGLARESRHWGDFPSRLQRARPDDRIYQLDLPGTGLRNREMSPLSVADMSLFVNQATQDLRRPLAVIGLSLGAMVALDWARTRADQCAGLILIGTSSGLSAPWQRFRPGNWWALIRMLLSSDVSAREESILELTSNRPVSPSLTHAWLDIARDRPVTRANVLRQLYAASRFHPQGPMPGLSALILASRADRLVDWHCSATLARASGWPLALHRSAGHDLVLDDPAWVINQINSRF